jgi:cation-transporting ATPase 13A3/4/5
VHRTKCLELCCGALAFRYWRYSLIILSITFVAVVSGTIQSRANFTRIREVSLLAMTVHVIRGGQGKEPEELQLSSEELVPGDLLVISGNMTLPCDCVLLSGETLMSESMLTGESIPVSKSAAHPGKPSTNKSVMLGGTLVLQARSIKGARVLARVRSTGFNSEKGRLVRSILFPSSGRDNPQRDGNRFGCPLLHHLLFSR